MDENNIMYLSFGCLFILLVIAIIISIMVGVLWGFISILIGGFVISILIGYLGYNSIK
jgi:hypothetical protein